MFHNDSEPDNIEKRNVTLATAVENHPKVALRALTQRLGVNYERMKKAMLECEEKHKRSQDCWTRSRKRYDPAQMRRYYTTWEVDHLLPTMRTPSFLWDARVLREGEVPRMTRQEMPPPKRDTKR